MAAVRVIGSINMDVVASALRHPRPGETVAGSDLRFLPGGKGANQAVAAARAGCAVSIVGGVGDDAFGDRLTAFLAEEEIDLTSVRTVPGPSGTAMIVVDEHGENTIVVVPGANAALHLGDDDLASIEADDVVVAQFETPTDATGAAFAAARAVGATTVLNPAPAKACPPELFADADIVVVNETEAAFFAGSPVDPDDALSVAATARRLRARAGQLVVVTLGARGVVGVDGDDILVVPGRSTAAVDTTGAGDCFVGNVAAALARNEALVAALGIANVAASLCVERHGAGVAMPTLAQTRAALAR